MTTTLLLADDHRLFRQGLALLADRQPGWRVIGEADDGEQALRLAEALQPTILVLDVEMPRMHGIDAARQVARVSPLTRMVALTMYSDIHYQEQMFAAGVSAYVLKNEAIDDLVAAVEAALRGERFVSASALRSDDGPRYARSAELDQSALTERERGVLRLLAEGYRTADIAAELGIGSKTVETHRSRIMLKLGIRNLAGLVKFAIRSGIITSSP